ncbi:MULTISPECIES: 1-phosphofructokinase family hexose kinase [Kocuria]|uniref:1-phosphofructokinase family hexose kinase n=1 Tax=Kocuria TaxID=57493 RepID=UPI000BF114F8|nr:MULTISPECIES: PfkB family carbohydrate kinase [Kocuria]MBX7556378.1 bifunctional hydroxymethylpyrimidine kinase/phosphomethylpyrimidine kinase [Streptomyces sp. tea 10]MBN6812752.1 bifunctional hydroxymethylpyrimidine kinase/phosphomethylpyrimidine kinase [Kocuria indica]MBN6844445.1 bifunctional hydroxymethylpyrimidine kinase/phosphomethylpyrimidine kinase [Kocuria indica]MCT2361111.1 PfkB family carbohydrate kinase [Kocuria marina]GHD85878.1 1-phosphofructokinase [Kocuria marina]
MTETRPGPKPRISILVPTPLLITEITEPAAHRNRSSHESDVHMHPGGQGLWVARMAGSLGADVSVSGPFGGELGSLIRTMLDGLGMQVNAVRYGYGNGGYVYDLRGEDRETVAHMPPPELSRHELDDLYGTAFVDALASDVLTVTGAEPGDVVPASFFGRLIRDTRDAGTTVVADLSGKPALAAVAANVDVLKISHEEVLDLELVAEDTAEALVSAGHMLLERGAGAVVISRAKDPALLVEKDSVREVSAPSITPLDHRGAGDSMTAGISVGLARGLDLVEAVALGASAGALNVARRGLGTGNRTTIEKFAREITVRTLS